MAQSLSWTVAAKRRKYWGSESMGWNEEDREGVAPPAVGVPGSTRGKMKSFWKILHVGSFYTVRRYASAVYMLSSCVRLSVCHKQALYQNRQTSDHANNAIR